MGGLIALGGQANQLTAEAGRATERGLASLGQGFAMMGSQIGVSKRQQKQLDHEKSMQEKRLAAAQEEAARAEARQSRRENFAQNAALLEVIEGQHRLARGALSELEGARLMDPEGFAASGMDAQLEQARADADAVSKQRNMVLGRLGLEMPNLGDPGMTSTVTAHRAEGGTVEAPVLGDDPFVVGRSIQAEMEALQEKLKGVRPEQQILTASIHNRLRRLAFQHNLVVQRQIDASFDLMTRNAIETMALDAQPVLGRPLTEQEKSHFAQKVRMDLEQMKAAAHENGGVPSEQQRRLILENLRDSLKGAFEAIAQRTEEAQERIRRGAARTGEATQRSLLQGVEARAKEEAAAKAMSVRSNATVRMIARGLGEITPEQRADLEAVTSEFFQRSEGGSPSDAEVRMFVADQTDLRKGAESITPDRALEVLRSNAKAPPLDLDAEAAGFEPVRPGPKVPMPSNEETVAYLEAQERMSPGFLAKAKSSPSISPSEAMMIGEALRNVSAQPAGKWGDRETPEGGVADPEQVRQAARIMTDFVAGRLSQSAALQNLKRFGINGAEEARRILTAAGYDTERLRRMAAESTGQPDLRQVQVRRPDMGR